MPVFKERGGDEDRANAAGPVGPARLGFRSEHSHRAVLSKIFKTPFFFIYRTEIIRVLLHRAVTRFK